MARARSKPVVPEAPALSPELTQLDLFPESPEIVRLNPRTVAGQRTAVVEVVRVRMRSSEAPHLIFNDRHGWYCETHGTQCAAIPLAQAAIKHEGELDV
ncbi:MAG: hypothetical protein ABI120_01255 [Gemmatimonadaceae bacterium]